MEIGNNAVLTIRYEHTDEVKIFTMFSLEKIIEKINHAHAQHNNGICVKSIKLIIE